MATASYASTDAITSSNGGGRTSPLPIKPKLLAPLLDDRL
jgi:hypothetical protein